MRCALHPAVSSFSSGVRPQPATSSAAHTAKLGRVNLAIEDSREGQPAKYSAAENADPLRRFRVPVEMGGQRIDQVLAQLMPEHSRNRLQGWLKAGAVRVDGREVAPKHKVWGGEELIVRPAPVADDSPDRAQHIPLEVVFEDPALLVINKPAGLVVHPGSGNADGTLLNALLHHAPELAGVPRAGIVHRLDKDTSGLLVVARTLAAQTDLVRQLQARSVSRHYLALAHGAIRGDCGRAEMPIGRHPVHRTRMAVVGSGKPAITHFSVCERFAECTLVECRLETGRTHQIRVHMAELGHPLVGDPVYAGRHARSGPAFGRQALHAFRLALSNPLSGERQAWQIGLPDDFVDLLAGLR